MTEFDPGAFANHLMDIEYAAEQRCERNAQSAHDEPLRAHLLLQAARHRSIASRLSDAIVAMDGILHTGGADSVLVDPLGPGMLDAAASDSALLENCISEQAKALPVYEHALQHGDRWPPTVRPLITQCFEAARQAQEQLQALRPTVA